MQSKLQTEQETSPRLSAPAGSWPRSPATPLLSGSPWAPRSLSLAHAGEPQEEFRCQPSVKARFLPGSPGPGSDHGLGQPPGEEKELGRGRSPEKARSGRQASRGVPGPYDDPRSPAGVGGWVGLRVQGQNRRPTAGAGSAWFPKIHLHVLPCRLPPAAPSLSGASHTGLPRPLVGGLASRTLPKVAPRSDWGQGVSAKRQFWARHCSQQLRGEPAPPV